jgi:hypothetical protein
MLTAVEPSVRIEVSSCRRCSMPVGRWRVAWLVHNDGSSPLRLEDAWIPHGRFRGEGHVPLQIKIAPGAASRIELSVFSAEPPGTVVENAFVILRVRGAERAWRVFARMRVEFDDAGAAGPIVEAVTAQSIQ